MLSVGIKLAEVNDITSKNYGFNVLDWDNDRKGYLVAKCSFNESDLNVRQIEDISELPKTLESKSAEEIATIFNQIFQKFNHLQLPDTTIKAKGLNMRTCAGQIIPFKPFIFIMGNKI